MWTMAPTITIRKAKLDQVAMTQATVNSRSIGRTRR